MAANHFRTILLAIFVAMVATSLFSTDASAQTTVCSELDETSCLVSTDCMLSLRDPTGPYTCEPPWDLCQIGFAQEILDEKQEFPVDNSNALSKQQCVSQTGCAYVPAGPCYCPPGLNCICGGGRPPDCQPASGALLTPPDGNFTVVDARAVTGVAAAPMSLTAEAIGKEISLTSDGIGMDGVTCDAWEIRETYSPVILSDPLLSDVLIEQTITDKSDNRLLRGWNYACEGEVFLELVQVDNRVIVIPWDNGATHLIAEKPLGSDKIMDMQIALRDAGLFDATVSGTLDEKTLEAISLLPETSTNSAPTYRFKRTALTQNMLDYIADLKRR